MAELSERQKQFIVAQLAAYYSPSEVVELFEEAFDQKITKQHVNLYNPETVANKEVGQKWKDYFDQCRTAFLNDTIRIPIAQKNYRLREMDALYRAQKRKSVKMALKTLEQAAKDAGGLLERQVTEKGDDTNDTLPAEFETAIDKIYKPSESDDVSSEPSQHETSSGS